MPSATSSRPPSLNGRRSNPRLGLHVEVGLESDSNFYMGFSENISEGGLFLATYSIRPVGTELDLSLKLPYQEEPVRARGTVRWVREFSESSDAPPGMGVRFERIAEEDEPRIRAFLSSRPPMFFDDE
jgi:uncharacterized protein (TIGR02266 family)